MPLLNQIKVQAPATSANLGPGFDVFGLALEYPSDTVTLSLNTEGRTKIKVTGIQAETISTISQRNTAGVVADFMKREFSLKAGLNIQIEKGIWPSKGLGSSAASASAVAFGINEMFNLKLSKNKLVQLASKGEVASAGSEHADNVSAAIMGGFVILRSQRPIGIIGLKTPENMEICIAFPHMITPPHKTEKARSLLPRTVPLENIVLNIGNAASMVSGFSNGDVDLIGKSMSDSIVEPVRASLIPGYLKVKDNALKAGASGVTISGAGPAMLSIVDKKKSDSTKVVLAMKEGFNSAGYEATAFATKAGRGVSISEK